MVRMGCTAAVSKKSILLREGLINHSREVPSVSVRLQTVRLNKALGDLYGSR
jgi:hypothetical protein